MSGWRDRLRPAKFRDAAFFVETSERAGGRRVVRHQFPLRDSIYAEDLGRAARGFSVEAYVVGPNYLVARDALLAELEKAGPGELVLPLDKPRQVVVDGDFRVRESRDEGGMARFSLTFVETDEKLRQPVATPDAAGALATSAESARTAIGSTFLGSYAPGALLASLSMSLQSASLKIRQALTQVTKTGQERAAAERLLATFEADMSNLVAGPEELLASVLGLFDLFTDDPDPVLTVYTFSPGVRPPATTVNRLREQANFDALRRLVQRLALVRAVELTAAATYSSYEEAVKAREAVADLLDDQAELTTDDAYPALLQLRADLVRAVPPAGATLAHLLPYTPNTPVPSLVLAHRLYGDLSLEQDLIARNGIRNPGFIPGGMPLEVLSRG